MKNALFTPNTPPPAESTESFLAELRQHEQELIAAFSRATRGELELRLLHKDGKVTRVVKQLDLEVLLLQLTGGVERFVRVEHVNLGAVLLNLKFVEGERRQHGRTFLSITPGMLASSRLEVRGRLKLPVVKHQSALQGLA